MKTNLKGLLGGALLAALTSPALHAATWLTDINAAQAQAAREGKTVLINFTGSDWCGWCIKLRNEVFSQREFDDYAARHLVLVEADFPERIPQSAALKQSNKALASKYNISGYPTLILLNGQGKQIGRSGYQAGGAGPFVQRLAKTTGVQYVSAPSAPAGPPPKPLPLYGGAAIAAPPSYDELELKSISGPQKRRFALLNDQTLGVGESARVRLGKGEVRVKCLEIRNDSVLVSVNGEEKPRVIKLKDPQ